LRTKRTENKFDKEYNFRRPYNSCDVAEYHVEGYMTKLETLIDYVAPFEIIKNIENSRAKDRAKENKIEEVDEDEEEDKESEPVPEEPKTEEVKPEEAKVNELKDNPQEETKIDKVTRDEKKPRQLLEGFKRLNVKLHFLTGKISNFYQKSKYSKLFNVVALSMRCSDRLNKDFNQLLADGCFIHVENGNKLVIFDEQNKRDYIVKLNEYTK